MIDLRLIEQIGFDRAVATGRVGGGGSSGHTPSVPLHRPGTRPGSLPRSPPPHPSTSLRTVTRRGRRTVRKLRWHAESQFTRWWTAVGRAARRLDRDATRHELPRLKVLLTALAITAAVAAAATVAYVGPTDRFVTTMRPLRHDQRVTDQMAEDIAATLSAPGAAGGMDPAQAEVNARRFVDSREFDSAWEQFLVDARDGEVTGSYAPVGKAPAISERYADQLSGLVGVAERAKAVTLAVSLLSVVALFVRSRRRMHLTVALSALTALTAVVLAIAAPVAFATAAHLVASGSMLPLTQAAGEEMVGPARRWLLALSTGAILVGLLAQSVRVTRRSKSSGHGHPRQTRGGHRPTASPVRPVAPARSGAAVSQRALSAHR